MKSPNRIDKHSGAETYEVFVTKKEAPRFLVKEKFPANGSVTQLVELTGPISDKSD